MMDFPRVFHPGYAKDRKEGNEHGHQIPLGESQNRWDARIGCKGFPQSPFCFKVFPVWGTGKMALLLIDCFHIFNGNSAVWIPHQLCLAVSENNMYVLSAQMCVFDSWFWEDICKSLNFSQPQFPHMKKDIIHRLQRCFVKIQWYNFDVRITYLPWSRDKISNFLIFVFSLPRNISVASISWREKSWEFWVGVFSTQAKYSFTRYLM